MQHLRVCEKLWLKKKKKEACGKEFWHFIVHVGHVGRNCVWGYKWHSERVVSFLKEGYFRVAKCKSVWSSITLFRMENPPDFMYLKSSEIVDNVLIMIICCPFMGNLWPSNDEPGFLRKQNYWQQISAETFNYFNFPGMLPNVWEVIFHCVSVLGQTTYHTAVCVFGSVSPCVSCKGFWFMIFFSFVFML